MPTRIDKINNYANQVKNIGDKVNNYANEVKNITDKLNNYANWFMVSLESKTKLHFSKQRPGLIRYFAKKIVY